jgi:protein-disulfide isomerase
VVVFSDFECPSCARFAEFVETQAQPLFAGRLKIIFKHYPLDKSCNDRTTQTVHRYACHGTAMVEAARTLGGNDAFWRAHDYVYKHREALAAGKLTPQDVAAAIGLDAAALAGAVQSEQHRPRVAEDVEQARLADVRGTPAIFVEGRLVETVAATEIGFWDKLADLYWQRHNLPRPPDTRPKAPATPSNPGPKDAP